MDDGKYLSSSKLARSASASAVREKFNAGGAGHPNWTSFHAIQDES